MLLSDFRLKNPQYNDMDDGALTTALHKKYYSDVDFNEFSQSIGYEAQPENAANDIVSAFQGVVNEGVNNPLLNQKQSVVDYQNPIESETLNIRGTDIQTGEQFPVISNNKNILRDIAEPNWRENQLVESIDQMAPGTRKPSGMYPSENKSDLRISLENLFGERGQVTPESNAEDMVHAAAQMNAGRGETAKEYLENTGQRTGVLTRTAKDVASGAVSTAEGMLGYVARMTDSNGMRVAQDEMSNKAHELMPANPQFLDELAAGFGSTATFFVPGLGVMKGAQAVAKVSPTMGAWLGSGAAAGMEAATESGAVYTELRNSGMSHNESAQKADAVFWANAALVSVTNKFGLFNESGGQLARRSLAAVNEGVLQEGPQQAISNIATGKDWVEGVPKSMAIGSIVGTTLAGNTRSKKEEVGAELDKSIENTAVNQDAVDAAIRDQLNPNNQAENNINTSEPPAVQIANALKASVQQPKSTSPYANNDMGSNVVELSKQKNTPQNNAVKPSEVAAEEKKETKPSRIKELLQLQSNLQENGYNDKAELDTKLREIKSLADEVAYGEVEREDYQQAVDVKKWAVEFGHSTNKKDNQVIHQNDVKKETNTLQQSSEQSEMEFKSPQSINEELSSNEVKGEAKKEKNKKKSKDKPVENIANNKERSPNEEEMNYPATNDARILKARENQRGKQPPKSENYKNDDGSEDYSSYLKDFNANRAESWMAESAGIVEATSYERYKLHEAADAQKLALQSKIGAPLKHDGKLFMAGAWGAMGNNDVPVRRIYPLEEYTGKTHTEANGPYEGRIVKHGKKSYVIGEQWLLTSKEGTKTSNEKNDEHEPESSKPKDSDTKRKNNPPSDLDRWEAHDSLMDDMRDGKLTLKQYRDSFEELAANRETVIEELSKETKKTLLSRMGAMDAQRYKSEKKASVVESLYVDMLKDYIPPSSDGGGMYSYSPKVGGDFIQSMIDVVREKVESVTDKKLNAYAERIADQQKENDKEREEYEKGLEDPQTAEDYQRLIYVRAQEIGEGATFNEARMTLTSKQRKHFDDLVAEDTRTKREENRKEERSRVNAAGERTETEIIATEHTRDHYPLWVVKPADRVEKDVYREWLTAAKKMGGWYSRYNKGGAIAGFQFKDKESAEAFQDYVTDGNTEGVKEKAKARRNAFEDDRSQSAVERLNEMADRLEERANEKLNQDRKTNTQRRASMAARAEAAAENDKAIAITMRNIANSIESGNAKFLDRVRTKAQVEMMTSAVNVGKDAQLREKYPSYSDYEKHKGEAPDEETIDYVSWPFYTAYRSDLARLGRQALETDGLKMIGQKIMKVADDVTESYLKYAKENLHDVAVFQSKNGAKAAFKSKKMATESILRSGFRGQAIVLPVKRGENLIILSPSEAMKRGVWDGDNDKRISLNPSFIESLIGKARRKNKIDVPWQFESAYEKRTRLKSMGIETPAEYRSALREFLESQELAAEPDKIKEMERKMIGRKKDGLDFFPTPESTADEMVDIADIKEGMSVLEPSAGMGHIAEQIRAAEIEPDVVEFSGDRRELLEAKGFNVVASDFLSVSEKYDRIIMNPPFSERRDAEHVQHAYDLLKPDGRIVAIMGEGVFFGKDKKAKAFREWLDKVGGSEEKLEEGTFNDPNLPVNTSVNARLVVIDKSSNASFSKDKAASSGLSVSEVEKIIAPVVLKWGDKAPKIEVVDSIEDVPEHIVDASEDGMGDVNALHYGAEEQVYLIASKLADKEHVLSKLAHEAVGHHSFEDMMGDDLQQVLERVQWLKKSGDKKLNAISEEVFKRYGRLDKVTEAKEIVALVAEKGVSHPLLTKVVAAIRRFLRKLGISLKWTKTELDALVVKAAKNLEKNRSKKEKKARKEKVKHFSREDNERYFSREPEEILNDINEEAGKVPTYDEVKDLVKNANTKTRPMWLKLLTRRHLADIGNDVLPTIKTYVLTAEKMDAFRNELVAESSAVAKDWTKWATQPENVKAADTMINIMHEATIAGVDPAESYNAVIDLKTVKEEVNKQFRFARSMPGDASKYISKVNEIKERAGFEKKRAAAYPELKRKFDALPKKAKEIYKEVRDHYVERMNATEQALLDKIDRAELSAKEKDQYKVEMRHQFESVRIEGPYFPLARFGDYWAKVLIPTEWQKKYSILDKGFTSKESEHGKWAVTHKDSKHAIETFETKEDAIKWASDKSMDYEFYMFEKIKHRNNLVKKKEAQGFKVKTGYKIEKGSREDIVSEGFISNVLGVVDKTLSGTMADKAKDEIYQLFLNTLPDMSMRKSFIHRQKKEGFTHDALRAFSNHNFHGAYQLSKLKYADVLQAQLENMEEQARDMSGEKADKAAQILNETKKRHDWAMNPMGASWANNVTQFNFVWYLGATPAAAIVNMSQTAMVAFPSMGAKFGFTKAGQELLKATKEFASNRIELKDGLFSIEGALKGDELRAYRHLVDTGIIDKTLAHDLAAMSETPSAIYSPKKDKVMGAVSYAFHHAERFNREVTSIATYRLARKKGMGHDAAVQAAYDMVDATHFNYSNANKAAFMQHDIAKVAFIFKQYSLNMIYLMARSTYQSVKGESAEVKKEARKKLGGILFMAYLFVGYDGMPWLPFGLIDLILESIWDDEDEPYDIEAERRNFLTEHLGSTWSDILTVGPVETATGAGISGRLSLKDLWLRSSDREMEAKDDYVQFITESLGPTFAIGYNWSRGIDMMQQGHVQRGIETMLPKGIKDPMKSYRYVDEGVNTFKGDPIIQDVSKWEAFLQFIGFSVARANKQYDAKSAIKNTESRLNNRRKLLMNQLAIAIHTGDKSWHKDILKDIGQYNRKNPRNAITPDGIYRSLQMRARTSAMTKNGVYLRKNMQHLRNKGKFADE